jgi:hypothetical protein
MFEAFIAPVGDVAYTLGSIVGTIGCIAVLITLVVVVIRAMSRKPAAKVQLSPDRQFWWDGSIWHPAATEVPPTAPRSADGMYWWDGVSWRPKP